MAAIDPDHLPPLPDPFACEDGYHWMRSLSDDWKAVPTWRNAPLGDWPYAIVAIHDNRAKDIYGYVRYVVTNDLIIGAWDASHERDIEIDNYSWWYNPWPSR